MPPSLDYVALLYEALAAERWGIKVESESAEKLRQKLYPIRKSREEFLPLTFIISPFNPRILFIAKQGKPDAEKP